MTNIFIVDADGLIASLYGEDANADKALSILKKASTQGITLIYPVTTIIETTTTLQRKLKRSDLAAKVITLIKNQQFELEVIEEEILNEAIVLFNPYGSKKNTLFDAIVAAVAKKYEADAIFSFDNWYEKAGFTLAGSL